MGLMIELEWGGGEYTLGLSLSMHLIFTKKYVSRFLA